MILVLILFCSFYIQGWEPYLYDFIKNDFNVGLYSGVY